MSPRIPLPAISIERSCSLAMPSDLEEAMEPQLEVWLACTNWPQRFALIRVLFESWGLEGIPEDDQPLRAEANFRILSAWLEQLGETEITDAYQAVTYRLSFHREWQQAGAEWLGSEYGSAFLEALVDNCPPYVVAAAHHVALFGLPE
jgi:hypothetical protein